VRGMGREEGRQVNRSQVMYDVPVRTAVLGLGGD